MKMLVLGMLVLGLSSANADGTNPKSGSVTAYGYSYCKSDDSRFACEDRACENAETNAEAETVSECSSYGGVNDSYFSGYKTYTLEENTSLGICQYGLKYECIH